MMLWRSQGGPCDDSFIDEANPRQFPSNSLERDGWLAARGRDAVGIMMWAWVIGGILLAAVVNQIAIALCRRAQVATEPDQYEH